MKDLHENYEKACNAYIAAFEKKQEMCFDFWVADRVGEVADFGCFSIHFSEIKHDIDHEVEKGKIVDYQDFICECYELGDPIINYQTWLKLKI